MLKYRDKNQKNFQIDKMTLGTSCKRLFYHVNDVILDLK